VQERLGEGPLQEKSVQKEQLKKKGLRRGGHQRENLGSPGKERETASGKVRNVGRKPPIKEKGRHDMEKEGLQRHQHQKKAG